MFTGIIEEVGKVKDFEKGRLRIACKTVVSDLPVGGSIAVNGACLTAVEIGADEFGADVAPETLKRTNFGDLKAGSVVNLERPLLPTTRLSGHFVQGHVDATGEILSLDELGDKNFWLRVAVPREFERYLVYKGSIAIDGISLTLAQVAEREVAVTIIPHTMDQTNLGHRRRGDQVNLECDVIAKHLEKLLTQYRTT